MKVLIFSGPSVSNRPEIKDKFGEFIFLPPARHAELISSVEFYHPDIIGIIDDYSGNGESIWHNEIMYILHKGIKIFGAGGTGAIRAAELKDFGMSGVGEVYTFFANSIIAADDEVICLFDEKDNYKKLTEPFINIRFTISNMKLRTDLSEKILDIIKNIYWKNRTRNMIIEKLEQHKIDNAFIDKFELNFVDIQEKDALQLLKIIEQEAKGHAEIKDKAPNLADGNLFRIMYERDRKVKSETGETTLNEVANHTVLNHPASKELVFNGLNREIVAFMAGYLGVEVNCDDVAKEIDRFKRKHKIANDEEFEKWLDKNDFNEQDHYELMKKNALCRIMQKWFASRRKYRRLTSVINEQLVLSGEYEKYKDKVINMEKGLSREEIKEKFNTSTLNELVANRMRRNDFPWNFHPFNGASESGFSMAQLQLSLSKEEAAFDKIMQKIPEWFNLEI